MTTTAHDANVGWIPALPYAGTSGWSGSNTSKERAISADEDGTTSRRQQYVLDQLNWYEDMGLTWKELSNITGWHHGTASGVLSVLHKVGLISRLKEKRGRCAVYVLPQWTLGKETAERNKHICKNCGFEN